jgi:hypothetical protein
MNFKVQKFFAVWHLFEARLDKKILFWVFNSALILKKNIWSQTNGLPINNVE